MAEGTIDNPNGYSIQSAGTYTFSNIICPGYITGSGNYFGFFFYITSNPNLTVSSISAESIYVYLAGSRIDISSSSITLINKTQYGMRLELHFSSTQTPNIAGSINMTMSVTFQ